MANDDLTIRVRMSGAKAAAAEAKQLATGVESVGRGAGRGTGALSRFSGAAGRAHKSTGRLRSAISGLGGGYFHAAKGILAAGAAFASYEGVKTAVEQTDSLAQTTLRLTKNTAFDTQTASEWAAVAKVRGIDANRLGQTLAKMSKTVEGGLAGQKASVDTWHQLGITHRDLIRSGKNMPGFLGKIADRMQTLGPGTKRTAVAQSLFGRSWQTLIPILRDGSGALNKQLQMAKDYGAALGEGGTVKVEDFIKQQRKAQFAMLGFQVTLGTTVIPLLTKGLVAFSKFTLGMRKGTGAGGRFAAQAKRIGQGLLPVAQWALRAARAVAKFAGNHPGLVKIAASLFLMDRALRAMRFAGAIAGFAKLGKFGLLAVAKILGKGGFGKLAGGVRASVISAAATVGGPKNIAKFAAGGRLLAGALITGLSAYLASHTPHLGGSWLEKLILPLAPKGDTGGITAGDPKHPIVLPGGQFDAIAHHGVHVAPHSGSTTRGGGPTGRGKFVAPSAPRQGGSGGQSQLTPELHATIVMPNGKVLAQVVATETQNRSNRR